MKLLVVGSTGRTGRHVLDQGIKRGHTITAFSRRAHELEGFEGLAGVISGDGVNLDDLRRAVRGQDAVIMAGGGSAVVHNLILAMQEAAIKRLVITSSRSIVATRPRLPVALAWMIFRENYVDLARAEGMLEVSDLDWSIVRATMLNDKPYIGQVHTDFEANATGGDWSLTRADYAATLLNVLEDPHMIGRAVGVANAKPVRKSQPSAA